MVCMQQAAKRQGHIEQNNAAAATDEVTTHEKAPQPTAASRSNTDMDEQTDEHRPTEEAGDRLQLQHFAGSNIISHPPVYSENGEYLLVINRTVIHVFSTLTGELTRRIEGTDDKLVSLQFELRDSSVLVACTMAGDVLRWNWQTGELLKRVKLSVPVGEVHTFNLINYYARSETACAFVTIRVKARQPYEWAIFDTSSGFVERVPLNLLLYARPVLVSVGVNKFKYIVLAQSAAVTFIDYSAWRMIHLKNAHNVHVTVVRMHPTEETVATGDENGRIFLWREFMQKDTVKTSLFHWHHTAVTSIVFSPIGTSFYSSGLESVLVKWNINEPNLRNYVPRMPSIIKQIAINHDNTLIAVGTADNGVQVIGSEFRMKCTLQEFTYIMDDKTGQSKFPVGLRLNPRTNTLVLNGRVGHLQFYSVATRSLLYNLDVVQQNKLSMEDGKILYNIGVTKSAFNIDWMATGEVYNDEQHFPELRLKFWQFDELTQKYVLNTNVELPHEGGLKAIEFSSEYQVENLLCATVGTDNVIKMWALEETDDIYKKGKVVWYCVAQASYKDMAVEAISFSQDGSLLAAGCGNTLCIYKASTLKLKAALTGSAGLDGCVQKAQVRVPKQPGAANASSKRAELLEQRKKLLQLLTSFLEGNDQRLIQQLQQAVQPTVRPVDKLTVDDDAQKQLLYNNILQMHELNLFQKVLLYQKLGIRAKLPPGWQKKANAYLNSTVGREGVHKRVGQLDGRVQRVNVRDRFKAKWRLQEYARRKRCYDVTVTQHLVPLLSVLSLDKATTQPQLTNGMPASRTTAPAAAPTTPAAAAARRKPGPKQKSQKQLHPAASWSAADASRLGLPQLQTMAGISHVQFAAGEHAHLVVVCTESRVLVWNLLTLRLQLIFKLSVQHLAFDPNTNLLAAITRSNELHIFQPHIPFPVYQRRNLPNLYGATWMPRRHPKMCSINIDWQAQSTLYFLTENQEIVYLAAMDDDSTDAPPAITFANAATEGPRYSIFGTFATQQHTDKRSDAQVPSGPLITGKAGKSVVKSLIEMSTHTMPPLSLLCADFVKSLVKPADSVIEQPTKSHTNGGGSGGGVVVHMNGNATRTDDSEDNDDDDDDDDDADKKDDAQQQRHAEAIKLRQSILVKTEQLQQTHGRPPAHNAGAAAAATNRQLMKLATQTIELEF